MGMVGEHLAPADLYDERDAIARAAVNLYGAITVDDRTETFGGMLKKRTAGLSCGVGRAILPIIAVYAQYVAK